MVSATKFDDATCGALSPDGSTLVVGTERNKLCFFTVAGEKLEPSGEYTEHAAAVTAITFSDDGALMATGDARAAGGNIIVWALDGGVPTVKSTGWVFHTSRVTGLAFSADAKHLISSSMDCSIFVHCTDGSKRVQYKNVHEDGVQALCWLNPGTIATGGSEGTLRLWNYAA